jgi:hypothetical protein
MAHVEIISPWAEIGVTHRYLSRNPNWKGWISMDIPSGYD